MVQLPGASHGSCKVSQLAYPGRFFKRFHFVFHGLNLGMFRCANKKVPDWLFRTLLNNEPCVERPAVVSSQSDFQFASKVGIYNCMEDQNLYKHWCEINRCKSLLLQPIFTSYPSYRKIPVWHSNTMCIESNITSAAWQSDGLYDCPTVTFPSCEGNFLEIELMKNFMHW